MVSPYVGHESQVSGVEEHRLVGGKGDGMRLFLVRNGKGLEFTVSADRCADISRLSFRGLNMSHFAACGYVAPAYYDGVENGFLKSFTVGFLTTCGLNAVGVPCDDAGERLPLHGTVGNIPAEQVWWEKDGKEIRLHAVIKDQALGAHKLLMKRTIGCSLEENSLYVEDVIENEGDTEYPAMILYHMNMGYPLLSEKSEIYIPSADVKPRTEHAAKDIDTWMKMLPPQPGFEEQCYFHSFDKDGLAAIYNPDIDQGLAIRFDPGSLPYFTEWKMMGCRDCVLGLEPGNCHPDGRDRMRAEGGLTILQPGESVRYHVDVSMIAGRDQWNAVCGKS